MTLSVLVVDDDPAFLALAIRILACLGVEVAGTAADAREALQLAHATRPSAVLIDVGLPDRNGIDLADELSGLPWLPRVVLTSSDPGASMAIGRRADRPRPPFIAKEDLGPEALRQALID